MTETKAAVQSIDLAKVLSNIKGGIKRMGDLSNELSHIRTRLFVNTYVWVEGMVANRSVRNETHAIALLAESVARSKQAVGQWFASGRLMRKHKMSPDDVNGHAVYTARFAESSLARADYLAVVSAVKKGVDGGSIKKMMNRGEVKNGRLAERLVRKALGSGLNKKTGAHIEMQVAYQLMCKAHGLEDGMLAFYDRNGKRLYKVGLDLED